MESHSEKLHRVNGPLVVQQGIKSRSVITLLDDTTGPCTDRYHMKQYW